MKDKIRWGIIGAGGIARRRTIPGIMLAEHAELVAVMGPHKDKVLEVKNEFGVKKAYTDVKALCADSEIDSVYIASPVAFHVPQAMIAADYGKNILLEKPIGMSYKEGKNLIEYCNQKKVQIGIGFMMRFGEHVQNMKINISEGKIGQVVSGFARLTNWLPDQSENWLHDRKIAGGGCMMDMAVHIIDLVEYISGMKITAVSSMNETITFKYDVEDTSTLLLRLENGAQIVVQTNFNIPDEVADWKIEFFGTRGKLVGKDIIGQDDTGICNGVFLEENTDYDPIQVHDADDGFSLDANFGNLYEREIESFCQSVLNNTPLVCPALDALRIQKIMDAAYKSSKENTTVWL